MRMLGGAVSLILGEFLTIFSDGYHDGLGPFAGDGPSVLGVFGEDEAGG